MQVRRILAVFIGALVSACTFTPHEVTITAQAPEVASKLGRGVTVAVNVLDDRDDLTVGQRGGGMQGADITAGDIVPTLERELTRGLQAQGFRVVPPGDRADAELRAKLRGFKFFVETGFWASTENASVVVGVRGLRAGKDFERVYRHSVEETIHTPPEGSEIDRHLNESLANVLHQIMTDSDLMRFLATSQVAERLPSS